MPAVAVRTASEARSLVEVSRMIRSLIVTAGAGLAPSIGGLDE
jgi:hypothetical protein